MQERPSLGGGLRQTLVNFFTENHILITLKFKNAPRLADFEESANDQDDEKTVEVLSVLTLTKMFDVQIATTFLNDNLDSSMTFIDMPFGNSDTFQMIVDWIQGKQRPKDSVTLEKCLEFAQFYDITLPQNGGVECDPEGVCCEDEDGGASLPCYTESNTEKTLHGEFFNDEKCLLLEGRTYKRRWMNRQRDGWYYYCSLCGCGTVLVLENGEIRKVKEHNPEKCVQRDEREVDSTVALREWRIIDSELKRIANENPTAQAFEILSMFLEENEELQSTIFTASISALLQFISSLRQKESLCLDERLTLSSRIERGGVIYQQVLPTRLLIYSCKESQKLADEVQWLLIDGTFRRCPKQFYQCVTLLSRDESNGVFFPICHCLLPNKEAGTYALMFSILERSFSFQNLAFITIDFEKALISSARTWIIRKERPVRILGCKFHFSKCLNKHFRKKKAKKLEQQHKYFIEQFLRFPFLTKGDIVAILNGLQTVQHPHEDFVRYFTRTWLEDDMFLLWNFSSMDDQGLITMYTNNAIEAFHKRMAIELSPHPQVQRFLRWVESYGKEKHRARSVIAPRDSTKSSQQWKDRMDIRACWKHILQDFATKPEFCAIHFEFTCPKCQCINLLAGRRGSHLLCQNQDCFGSKVELQYQCVLDQAKQSLIASCMSLPVANANDQKETEILLWKLGFWFTTLASESCTEAQKAYLSEMRKLVGSLEHAAWEMGQGWRDRLV